MGSLLLVRHGQASWGTDDYDVLSPLGWEQGRLLGQSLAARGVTPDLVVRGDMRRHRETAEAIAQGAGWDVPVEVDGAWDEFDHLAVLARHDESLVDELDRQQFQAWFEAAMRRWSSGDHDAEYHEPFAAFTERVVRALERVVERVPPSGTVLVVTSGGPVAWSAVALVNDWERGEGPAPYAAAWARLNTVAVNSGVSKVVVGRRGTTLVTFNEHSHLEGGPLTYR